MTPAFDDPRLERLASKLSEASSNGAVTLAYSGGLDSRFLAFFAKLADFRVRLLHVTGPHVAPAETAEAVAEARAMGLEAELVPLDPADMPDLAAAGRLRCYICKRHIFTELLRIAGDVPLCDGTNHSDLAVYRPGRLQRPTSARTRYVRSAPHSAFAIRVRWQGPACSPAFPTA